MARGKHRRKQHIKSNQPEVQPSVKQREISDLKKEFLEQYPLHGTIAATLKIIGLSSRNSFYDWLAKDEQFEADFERVKEEYVEKLEEEADRRAVAGVVKPLFYKGMPVISRDGTPVIIREYSDTLLIFRLKSLAPEKYRERYETKVDVTSEGKSIESVVRVIDGKS